MDDLRPRGCRRSEEEANMVIHQAQMIEIADDDRVGELVRAMFFPPQSLSNIMTDVGYVQFSLTQMSGPD